MSNNAMEVVTHKDKEVYKIPLDLSDVLDVHRMEIPDHILLETCDSCMCEDGVEATDGEIVLMNFLDGGISLHGVISGYQDNILHSAEFVIAPKENSFIGGWDYSEEHKIEVRVIAKLLTDQQIPLLDNFVIDNKSRCKHLIFFS